LSLALEQQMVSAVYMRSWEAFRCHAPVADFERMVSVGFSIMVENRPIATGGRAGVVSGPLAREVEGV